MVKNIYAKIQTVNRVEIHNKSWKAITQLSNEYDLPKETISTLTVLREHSKNLSLFKNQITYTDGIYYEK